MRQEVVAELWLTRHNFDGKQKQRTTLLTAIKLCGAGGGHRHRHGHAMTNNTGELTEAQVLAALAIVATPVGAAALLSEWLERVVTADEVAQAIAGSERLQRICAFCRSVQNPTSDSDLEARIRARAGPWQDRRCRR